MAKRKSSNNVFLRAGQLTTGSRSPVGSLQAARNFAASEAGKIGRIQFPGRKQAADNKKRGIDAYKQPVRGFWGKG